MQLTNYHTYTEIKTQTEAWRQALDVINASSLPKADDYDLVIFTGCGSTYYLSQAAAALYVELTGRPAQAISGGELLLNPQTVVPQTSSLRFLLVAISRSGTTTETIKAVEKFKSGKRGDVVVISNYNETLSHLADFNFVIDKGQEESVAQTRSFASMYVAVTALCAKMAGRDDLVEAMDKLPETGDWLIDKYEAFAKSIGENLAFDRFYFLGSGIRYGLACEVNLKMKEMTLTHSEPFHFLEFRHGPMSMVGKSTLVCGLLSTVNRQHEAKTLEEMKRLGGTVATVGEKEADVCFESNIPEEVRGVLYLPVLQLMSFHRSLAKGLNPDRPNNLTAVVKLDL
ncbi:MAG: SIS domain-containing protein [Anaerolineae bacterium]|nr:MAG: SIS domain-containing protein [Anaerolineae bacterium]WKZ44369.1 MAG: SIS domain-containing protein [Anaerolineales bacterium]